MAFEADRLKNLGGQNNEDFGGDLFSYTPSVASGDTLGSVSADDFFLEVERNLNVDDIIKIIASDGQSDVLVLTSSENGVTVGAMGSVQSISGPGVISLGTDLTEITTTGADAYTLANGVPGQGKKIVMVVDAGVAVVTGVYTNAASAATTLTFNGIGDSVDLLFTNTLNWVIMVNNSVVVA